jgi:hypothetical protein
VVAGVGDEQRAVGTEREPGRCVERGHAARTVEQPLAGAARQRDDRAVRIDAAHPVAVARVGDVDAAVGRDGDAERVGKRRA